MGITRENKVIRALSGIPTIQKFTPVATDMFLPNHSGMTSHPEAKKNFLLLDQTTKQTLTDSPIINDLTATRIPFVDTDKSLTDSSKLTYASTGLLTNIGTSVTDGFVNTGKLTITGIAGPSGYPGLGSSVSINGGNGGADGGTGGNITLQTGAGVNGTVSDVSDFPFVGKSGALNLYGSSGGNITNSNSGASIGGASTTFGFLTGSGGKGISNGTNNGIGGAGGSYNFNSTGGTGGVADTTTTANNTGGLGCGIIFKGGAGGAASKASGTNTGGAAGDISFQTLGGGTGGSVTTGNGTGGRAGNISFTASTGGGGVAPAGKTAIGGAGGNVTLTASNGGAAGSGTTNTGGAGGTFTITSGIGGIGSTAYGANGNILFKSSSTEIARFDNTAGAVGNFRLTLDNQKIQLGTAQDTAEYYDGTNLIINPKVVGTGYLSVLGDIRIVSDSLGFYTGAGSDMKIIYDGTVGKIDTSLVAASDLQVACGTDKTLVLTESVYNDANVGGLVLRTGGTAPGVVQWLDNDGDATGIYTIGFADGEQGSGSIEVPHDYKQGTNLVFHIHYGINDAPTGTDKIRFDLIYNVQRDGTTFVDATTIDSGDVTVDTQYKTGRIDFTAITGTNFLIGDQFNFTVKRTTAVGDAFAGEVLAQTLGFHYECDTLGSRQIGTK